MGYTLDVALFQCEQNDGVSEFEHRGYEQELYLCSRYFQRVQYGFNTNILSGQVPGSFGDTVNFYRPMRVVPLPVRKTHLSGPIADGTFPGYESPSPLIRGVNETKGGTNDAFLGITPVTQRGFQPSFIAPAAGDLGMYAVMDFDAEIAHSPHERMVSQTLTNPGPVAHYSGPHGAATRRIAGTDEISVANISTT
jgi:hypothetical protein